MWIDAHCHLQRFEREGSLEDVLARAEAAGVRQMIAVGTSWQDWEAYRALAERYPRRVFSTVGLHPTSVDDDWAEQLQALPSFFATEPRPVALGEIGLDYHHLPRFPDEAAEVIQRQKAAFAHQLDLALQLDCPVVIHSRKAFEDCCALITASGVPWERVVFHCFSEGPEAVAVLNSYGGRASFTGIVTYTQASAQPVAQALVRQGLDRLMLETDAPYLSPEPHRKAVNEPARTAVIGARAAELLGRDAAEVAAATTANTRAFFGLPEAS